MSNCFYQTVDCSTKMTREHVISDCVLRAVFGEDNSNLTRLPNGKFLTNHEAVIADVCDVCNNKKLSATDAAGRDLVQFLLANGGQTIALDAARLAWLLKTHLNHLRLIRDIRTNEVYAIPREMKDFVLSGGPPPVHACLYGSLWEDDGRFWDAENPGRIQFFSYRSIYALNGIIISDFRMRQFRTFLLLPHNGNIAGFDARCDDVLADMGEMAGEVLERMTFAPGNFTFTNLYAKEKIRNHIVEMPRDTQ